MHEDCHQGKVVSEITNFIWVWAGLPLLQLDCSILWSTISLDRINWYVKIYYMGDIHQWNVACETINFAWVRPGVSLVQLDSRILWSSVSLKGINWYPFQVIVFLSFLFMHFHASFIKLSLGPFSYDLFTSYSNFLLQLRVYFY